MKRKRAKAGLTMDLPARIGPAEIESAKIGPAKTRMGRVRATIGCNST